MSWCYPGRLGEGAGVLAVLRHPRKSASAANIPQMCACQGLFQAGKRGARVQPRRDECCVGGRLIDFVSERLARVRVTHSGLGYITVEHTPSALQQIPPVLSDTRGGAAGPDWSGS